MMNNVISFSLFDKTGDWQFLFYLRGLVLNVWMAKIVYPSFTIHVTVERSIYIKYRLLLDALGVTVIMRDEDTLCRMMLWRLLAIFELNADYVFPRDTDALVTTREVINVEQFIRSGKVLHGIHDNKAHSVPLLGGLCGFKTDLLYDQYGSWNNMISKATRPIDKHGSDQYFLNDIIFQDFKHSYFSEMLIEQKDGSDLCVSFVGAAGCNEFETLRYLRANNIDLSLGGVGNKFGSIFYWL